MSNLLEYLPQRPLRPRQTGVTMVMDKGLSMRDAESLIEIGGAYIDFIKLGFGTSLLTANTLAKVKLYQKAGLKVYVGGTLFEAFLVRGKFDDYRKYVDQLGIDTVEVSDGSIVLPHAEKCNFIQNLAKDYTVLSEVGSKEAGILIAPGRWISMMKAELDAGSWKVIAEARESGTVGIYRPDGTAHVALINRIVRQVNIESILWEAPGKSQQVWFIKHFGANVNLGNIAPDDIIPLETLRMGLRGDTFFHFLPDDFKQFKHLATAK